MRVVTPGLSGTRRFDVCIATLLISSKDPIEPSELYDALQALISERPFMRGACGVSKSQIVPQVAAERKYDFLDIRAVQLDPVDLRGLPRIFADGAEWAPQKSSARWRGHSVPR